MLREELGAPSSQLFATFAAEPIAAASLAQVHRATLRDGRHVAVKVQYPELRVNMASDMAVFRTMGAQVSSARMMRLMMRQSCLLTWHACVRRSSLVAWT